MDEIYTVADDQLIDLAVIKLLEFIVFVSMVFTKQECF